MQNQLRCSALSDTTSQALRDRAAFADSDVSPGSERQLKTRRNITGHLMFNQWLTCDSNARFRMPDASATARPCAAQPSSTRQRELPMSRPARAMRASASTISCMRDPEGRAAQPGVPHPAHRRGTGERRAGEARLSAGRGRSHPRAPVAAQARERSRTHAVASRCGSSSRPR